MNERVPFFKISKVSAGLLGKTFLGGGRIRSSKECMYGIVIYWERRFKSKKGRMR